MILARKISALFVRRPQKKLALNWTCEMCAYVARSRREMHVPPGWMMKNPSSGGARSVREGCELRKGGAGRRVASRACRLPGVQRAGGTSIAARPKGPPRIPCPPPRASPRPLAVQKNGRVRNTQGNHYFPIKKKKSKMKKGILRLEDIRVHLARKRWWRVQQAYG